MVSVSLTHLSPHKEFPRLATGSQVARRAELTISDKQNCPLSEAR